MIFIDRNHIPQPEIYTTKKYEAERERLFEFYASKKSKQLRYRYTIVGRQEINEALHKLFHSKCCYCESKLNTGSVDSQLEQFRPKSIYWWLMYEWMNHYLVCPVCNRYKANRFPVNGKRLEKGSIDITSEDYLLLDPCERGDIQDNLFVFDENGKMYGTTDRGEISINTIGLNRNNLQLSRAKVYKEITKKLDSLKDDSRLRIQYIFEQSLPDKEYSAVRNFVIDKWLSDNDKPTEGELLAKSIDFPPTETSRQIKDFDYSSKHQEEIVEKSFKIREEQQSYDLNIGDQITIDKYLSSAKYCERIEIRNFKSIRELIINFPAFVRFDTINEPWIILVGENGSGKSTILQALALTIMGQELANSIGLDAGKFIRNPVSGDPPDEAEVKVFLSNLDDPIVLKCNRNSDQFTIDPPEPKTVVLGYGSTRLLNDGTEDVFSGDRTIRNLFDPYAKLKNGKAWLSDESKVDEELFDEVAKAFKILLMLDDEVVFYRESSMIYIEHNNDRSELEDLSDGYQSVIALMLDIIVSVSDIWKKFRDSEVMVLIDEIDMHLHPRWKIRIVSLLREVFPRIRFVVTTHDPLCLRNTYDGEVHVLHRDKDTKEARVMQVDIPPNLPIDQLLMGNWFKLGSTLDQNTLKLMDEHRSLALSNQETDPDRMEEIEQEIFKRTRIPGDSSMMGALKLSPDDSMKQQMEALYQKEIDNYLKEKKRKRKLKK